MILTFIRWSGAIIGLIAILLVSYYASVPIDFKAIVGYLKAKPAA